MILNYQLRFIIKIKMRKTFPSIQTTTAGDGSIMSIQ